MPSVTTPRPAATAAAAPPGRQRIYRHALLVRISHWINVICLTALLMSGLQIFNAHPALYWGNKSTFDSPWLAIGVILLAIAVPAVAWRMLDESQRRRYRELRRRRELR